MLFVLGNFLPFYPTNSPKMKISKNWKKHQSISSFYTSVPKIIIICYTVPEIWHVTHVIIIFHFGLFFALLPPLQTKIKISKKNEKNYWRYHHFTHVYLKLWLDDVQFLRYGERWTDGQTAGRTEKETYSGGCPS